MGAIELDGISVAYGDVSAVDGVDLRVRDGELLVLVGPSGCGKTSILRTIAGLERPTGGDVYIADRRVTDLPARKRDVSLVFQDFALFPHLTVRENLSFDLRMQGYDDIDHRVDEAASLLDIVGLLGRSIDELSGGQKQRIALGRAIVTEPEAFLLDEPLANLDATLRSRMQTEISRIQDRLGVTTVHVTHDQSEALSMGDRIAVMRDGRIEQVGTPEAVYREPATRFVAGFVGRPSMNFLPGRIDRSAGEVTVEVDDRVRLTVPAPNAERDTDVTIGIRPEQLEVDGDRRSGTGRVTGTVAFQEFHGADRYLYLDVDGLPELVARVSPESAFRDGDDVSIRFPPARIHCFDPDSGLRIRASRPSSPDRFQVTGGGSP